MVFIGLILGGCAGAPLLHDSSKEPPLISVPAMGDAARDKSVRFRDIFCAVLESRKETIPDYRHCNTALANTNPNPPAQEKPVHLGIARHPLKLVFVPGLGWDCFSDWINAGKTAQEHLRQYGFDMVVLDTDGLADVKINATIIRDSILALPYETPYANIVLVGYSKGAIDALQAVVDYPEIHHRLAAVVSLAGVVGGSPLANDATDNQVNLMRYFPGAKCEPAGEGALQSLKPAVRQRWLAENPLPDRLLYYSLITLPEPDRISILLRSSYTKLSQVDTRNDGQLIFYDQFIPGSFLLGYLNADHWAAAVPIARHHGLVDALFLEHNAFPREAMLEALMRMIDEEKEHTSVTDPL